MHRLLQVARGTQLGEQLDFKNRKVGRVGLLEKDGTGQEQDNQNLKYLYSSQLASIVTRRQLHRYI